MAVQAREIVGRDDELAAITAFLAARELLPAALVIEGEAGIGKTMLWRAGVALAEEVGYRVLTAHPAEAEADLSFAGRRDLLEDAFDEVAEQLPAPQRRTLAIALLREESRQSVPDQGVVGASVRGALQALAEKRPLVVAVDDIQ
jgi:predicted ATPase